MKRVVAVDDPRRRIVLEALAAGLLSSGVPNGASAADLLGNRPKKLPPDQSIYRLTGQCTVNDREATKETRINAGDTIRTAGDSEIVFVVGTSSMMLRADSNVVLQADKPATEGQVGIRLISGRLLSVFAPGERRIETRVATIRVSGTGVYIETDPERTYFCTCYGTAEVSANDDRSSREQVRATHHDKPLYIFAGNKDPGRSIRSAPFINHTDEELALIEALVGRHPPFVHPKSQYEGLRDTDAYNR
jgi:hypothetical protein